MELRKSIINDNGLTKKRWPSSVFCEKNKNFDREIENGGYLKTVNFKKFSISKSGLAALIKKTAIEFQKSIINYNELTRGYAHLVYYVKNL